MMVNRAKWYAGQPYMISIWEHMWHRIYVRLDDKCEDFYLEGDDPPEKLLKQIQAAENHYEVLAAMLDEAHQLRDNVCRMDNQMQWKFNLVYRSSE